LVFPLAAVVVAFVCPARAPAYQAYLTVSPAAPRPGDAVSVSVELTNDTLDPCDYEVRLVAAYGGLTRFTETREEGRIVFRGELIPHLVPPTEVVPCEVMCIEVLLAPHAVYAEIPMGRLPPGRHEVHVYLPGLCPLQTRCPRHEVVSCDFVEPLRTVILVAGPTSVGLGRRLPLRWAALRRGLGGLPSFDGARADARSVRRAPRRAREAPQTRAAGR
jgi:hypothetical protein